MPWFKGDDKFHDQPELAYLSEAAVCLFWCAVSWSSSVGTDGFVPVGQLPRLKAGRPEIAQELCRSYLGKPAWWTEVEGGFQIRSFLKFNPSAAKIESGRRYETTRKAAYRAKCPAGTDTGTDAGTTGGSPTAPVPDPVPLRKKPPTGAKKEGFVPPTAEACAGYGRERGMPGSESRKFFDYWTSQGWRRKGGPMADWKASMRFWESNNPAQPNGKPDELPNAKDVPRVSVV